jgi:hypothetical protein
MVEALALFWIVLAGIALWLYDKKKEAGDQIQDLRDKFRVQSDILKKQAAIIGEQQFLIWRYRDGYWIKPDEKQIVINVQADSRTIYTQLQDYFDEPIMMVYEIPLRLERIPGTWTDAVVVVGGWSIILINDSDEGVVYETGDVIYEKS